MEVNNDLEKVNDEEESVPKASEPDNEEKMDAESIQHRRISQNSDLNEHRDSTPMQTDNEEVIHLLNTTYFPQVFCHDLNPLDLFLIIYPEPYQISFTPLAYCNKKVINLVVVLNDCYGVGVIAF